MSISNRVVNVDDLKLAHFKKGDTFEARYARVGPRVGAKDLGYSYDIVPPGKSACPFHAHRAAEEMFFIVRGTALLRYGAETRQIRAGDFICCPTGGADTAHQIINTSAEPLEYISVSTIAPADICEYPDSGKIGAFSGAGPDAIHHLTRPGQALDYWDGEI